MIDPQKAAAVPAAHDRFFRALVENSSDIITVLDAEGRRLYVSPSLQRILGYAPGEMLGRNAFDFIHPDDIEVVRAMYVSLLERPDAAESVMFRYRHANGAWLTFAATAWNLLDDAAVGGMVVNSRDVTDQVSLEAQLRQAQKMDALGQLAGGIAHDFNNLLTVIKGRTELMLAGLDATTALHVDASEIRRAALRAAELTHQLLAFSRKQELTPSLIDVNALVTDLTPMLDRIIGDDVEVVTRLATTPLYVRGDPGQMEQVLVNLAVNARDAMPHGGVVVISTTELNAMVPSGMNGKPAEHRSHVVIEVCDTGEGMDAATLARVFEPFFTTKPQGKGTGLGLSTAYGIIAQCGGHIAVESSVGRGSNFRIHLPLHGAGEDADVADNRADRPADDAEHAAQRILVVEDDDQVRRVTRVILERRGFRVLDACSGAEALEVLRRTRDVSLVLSDAVMPEMTGHVLAERISELRPSLPFLLMSGYTTDEISRRGIAGDNLLQKPFTAEGLTHAVRSKLREPVAA